MEVTIPGNKQTPEKAFKQGVIYKSLQKTEGFWADPKTVFFKLEEVKPDENRAVIYDLFRKKKIRISTKQHSMLTKYAEVFDSAEMREMVHIIFEMENWWVRYGFTKEEIYGKP